MKAERKREFVHSSPKRILFFAKIRTIYDLKFRKYYNFTFIRFAFDSFQKASNAVTTYVYRFVPPS